MSQYDTDIKQHMPLVTYIARRFRPKNHDDLEEYVQVGLIGLWHALKTYNVTKGYKFTTYAWKCISNQIIQFIHQNKKQVMITNTDIEYYGLPKESFDEYLPALSASERKIIALLLDNTSISDIAKQIHVSRTALYSTLKTIKHKIHIANGKTSHINS